MSEELLIPVTKGGLPVKVEVELSAAKDEAFKVPFPMYTAEDMPEPAAVTYSPPVPSNPVPLLVAKASCGVPVPSKTVAEGAADNVVELTARDGINDCCKGKGAVPSGVMGGGEVDAGSEDEGSSAGATIGLLDVEGTPFGDWSSACVCVCVELIATVELFETFSLLR